MVQKVEVEGFEAFVEKVESFKSSGKAIFVLFSGSKDAGGKSWCSDCVKAEPVVEEALNGAPDDAIFVHVGVGPRGFWKDPKCVFRTDARTRIKAVPTLMKYGGAQRLEEAQCAEAPVVQMLFQDA